MMSVCRLRTTQSSSATRPRCGNSSLIGKPDSPCCEKRKGEAIRGSTSVPRRWTAETLFPWSTAKRGLGSNVSTCEKPPVRKTKIRCLARAG